MRAIAVLFVVLSSMAPAAAQTTYTEDFTSTAAMDSSATTLDWDTASGALSLPDFVPTIVGALDSSHIADDLTVAGDLVLLADGWGGMHIIDVGDPANPILVSTYMPSDWCTSVAVDGDLAILGVDAAGLEIVDISDPAAPVLVGAVAVAGLNTGLDIDGDLVFVATGGHAMRVVDISDPTAPVVVGSYEPQASVRDVTVAGNLAFLAMYTAGLHVVDVSDPSSPTLVGSHDTPSLAGGIAVAGDHVFVADLGTAQIFDVSDPTMPTPVGQLPDMNAMDVVVSGDLALFANHVRGLALVDISDPTDPIMLPSADTPGAAYGVAVAGRHAFVADHGQGLQVIEIAASMAPESVGGIAATTVATQVEVSGDLAFMTNNVGGLQVIDIHDPSVPVQLSSLYLSQQYGWGLDHEGDVVYIAGGARFYAVDVSDPAAPAVLGSYNTPSNNMAFGVDVAGDVAYVADWHSGLLSVDVSDPTLPTLIDSFDTPYVARRVKTAGDRAYVADGNGFEIVDISDPADLTAVGRLEIQALDLELAGDVAVVAGGGSGLHLIDIGGPADPVLMATMPGYATDVDVAGDLVYVADNYDGYLRVYDIMNPALPVLTQTYPTGGAPHGVDVQGDHAYVADWDGGLQVIQVQQHQVAALFGVATSAAVATVTDTIWTVNVTATQTGDITWEISGNGGQNWQPVAPDKAWTALEFPGTELRWRFSGDWTPGVDPTVTGLMIEWNNDPSPVGNNLPSGFALHGAVPNPFNPATTISFDLPRTVPVRLTVHDLAGRRVATLLSEERQAGSHRVTWAGRDDAGRRVSSGVYLYRFEAGPHAGTGRVVLVK